MGKAFKAPHDTYSRKFGVTDHAVERLRERAPRDLKDRSDYDLGNMLDSAVREATEDPRNVEDILDDEVPAQVVVIKHLIDTDVVALVKESNIGAGGRTIITVLEPDKVAAKKATGRWRKRDRSPLALGRIGDKFGAALAAVPPTAPKPPEPKKIDAPPPPPPPPPPVAEEELRAICFETPGCAQPMSWWTCKKGEVAAQIAALLASGVSPATIRVWRPVATKTRVVVEVNEEG